MSKIVRAAGIKSIGFIGGTKVRWKILTLLSLLFFLHACALPQTRQDFRHGRQQYKDVFEAAIMAVDDIAFSVVSKNIDSGVIIAQKVLDNEQKSMTGRLEINIESVATGVKVAINYDSDIDTMKKALKEYVEAIKKRVPKQLSDRGERKRYR